MLTSFKKKGNISTVFIAIFFGYNQTFSIITLFALPSFNTSLYFNPLLITCISVTPFTFNVLKHL